MEILVTGGTGYVGGRLIPRLLDLGHRVRVLVRDPERVSGRAWYSQVQIFSGDLLKPGPELGQAFENVETAYYLIHSMSGKRDFAAADRQVAGNFVSLARGVQRVIYLGGIVPQQGQSSHLASRAEVGRILRESLPCTEFQAGPVIGSGSASFEMTRYLTERLPVMVAPRWILNEVQPIAVRDVLAYLLGALQLPPLGEIPIGTAPLTFKDMMLGYAAVRGLRRHIFPLPVLAPTLAAQWVGLVTPIPNSLAVPLIQGVVHPVVADTSRARELFPQIHPISYLRAVELAMQRTELGDVETRWSDALGREVSHRLVDREGLNRDVRTCVVNASPQRVFATFCSLGGERGWLRWGWLWWLRGLLDRLAGGPGLRRGRRHPQQLAVGDALDFWRVEALKAPQMLRLRAEMKVPGKAWLEFRCVAEGEQTRLIQTATFEPRGLPGALYWYALVPVHAFVFGDMIRALKQLAEADYKAT